MASNGKNPAKSRPMSPHLQIWRWHVTMATSILHRATGVANGAALILLLCFIGAIAGGPEAYAKFQSMFHNPFAQLILFGILVSISYHLVNGIRHLAFNVGIGLDKNLASKTGWLVIVLGLIGGIKLFVLGMMALGR